MSSVVEHHGKVTKAVVSRSGTGTVQLGLDKKALYHGSRQLQR